MTRPMTAVRTWRMEVEVVMLLPPISWTCRIHRSLCSFFVPKTTENKLSKDASACLFSSFSPVFPAKSLGFTTFVRFLHMWPFFNPIMEIVTFRLRGWHMLVVFLLPAFTCLGHEGQDLLSPCKEMHVCTDYSSVYSRIQKFFLGNGVRTHVNSKGKSPLLEAQRRTNSWCYITKDSEPNTLPTELCGPRACVWYWWWSADVPVAHFGFLHGLVLNLITISTLFPSLPSPPPPPPPPRPPRWPCGKASASRAEGPGLESRMRRDFFWVESYQWLKHWHSSDYPARRLAL